MLAVLVVIAVLAGVGIGRTLPHSTSVTAAGGSGGSGSGGSGLGGGSGSGSSGLGGNPGQVVPANPSPANPGPSTLVPGGSPGSSAGAGAPANTSAIAAKVAPALVDINTDLSYQQAQAAGTGIVLSANGLILTNNHVINGSTSITARDIGNGKTYKAAVVGYDASDDVALLQLQSASGLATASIGTAASVKVGTPVVAIGNAGGRGGVPSHAGGAVTGLNQSITASDQGNGTSEQLTGLIQTNSNIQAGDSGGSLVDAAGQVVGIDTAASQSFSFSSGTQGFAIPIDKAVTLARQIQAHQGSSRIHIGSTAFLGVGFTNQAVTGPTTQVSKVIGGTAAQGVGLAVGDVITSFGGQTVSTPASLTQLLVGHHPGDKVSLGWTTATGQARSGTVTLGDGPAA